MDPVAKRVSERFLLIERLDNWFLVAVFAALFLIVLQEVARNYKYRKTAIAFKTLSWVVAVVVFLYLYWRFFLAWKGIYYP